MNIFFDVDYTILSIDNALRPGTHDVFRRLVDDGHQIFIWSGRGLRWDVINEHGLEGFVSGVFEKPTYHYRQRLAELGVDVDIDFIVDDFQEIVEVLGGVRVKPFWYATAPDDELERVYDEISARAGLEMA